MRLQKVPNFQAFTTPHTHGHIECDLKTYKLRYHKREYSLQLAATAHTHTHNFSHSFPLFYCLFWIYSVFIEDPSVQQTYPQKEREKKKPKTEEQKLNSAFNVISIESTSNYILKGFYSSNGLWPSETITTMRRWL